MGIHGNTVASHKQHLLAHWQFSFSGRPAASPLVVLGQRNRSRLQNKTVQKAARISAPPAPKEADTPTSSSESGLPAGWEPGELHDTAIEDELRRLRAKEASSSASRSSQEPAHRVRGRSLRRHRAKLRRGRAVARNSATPRDHKLGQRLSAAEQERLCNQFREWQRLKDVQVELIRRAAEGEETPSLEEASNLTQEQLQAVWRDGSLAARTLLSSVHYLLVKFATGVTSREGSSLDDLQDALCEAKNLWLQAALLCDFSRASLNTFGQMFVTQRLFRVVDEERSLLQMPHTAIYAVFSLQRARAALVEKLKRQPTTEELAAKVRMPVLKVKHLLAVPTTTMSWDTETGSSADDDRTLADVIPTEESADGRDNNLLLAVREELEVGLRVALKHESESDQKLILRRYGLAGDPPAALNKLAKECGLSTEAIRKRIMRILGRLQADPKLVAGLRLYMEDGTLALEDPSLPQDSEFTQRRLSSGIESYAARD